MTSPQEPLLSHDWYRIAFLKPRLRAGVRVSHQRVRGEIWYVLSDPVSGRHHRFNGRAYSLIGSCDGHATIDDLWAQRVAVDGDNALTQGEAIRVFSQAFAASLFVGNVTPDAAAIVKSQASRDKRRRRSSLNPLAFRLPMWDPDEFLSAHIHRLIWLFHPITKGLVGVVIALGIVLLLLNANIVSDYAQRELGSGRMLMMMWIAYPLIKALHELAHAFTIKYHGGEVHEMGLTLLMLTPVPYVDATGSIAFSDKRQRIEVAAAGIVVEVFLASLALALWLVLEPGMAKDLMFAVVFVGALSTVVVNANPLLRFDGYYVLCDAAELPNLASRSAQFWQFAIKRWVLRLPLVRYSAPAAGELPWLMAYAPLSWAYRVVLVAMLAALATEWSTILGVTVTLLGLWLMLIKPILSIVHWIAQSGELRGYRPRAALGVLVTVIVLSSLGFGLPIAHRTHAPGVVWLPDDAMVRLGTEGFVERFMVNDGDHVESGDLIAQLGNEPLRASLIEVQARLDQEGTEQARYFNADAQRSMAAGDQLTRLTAERDRLQARLDALQVRAGIAGRVVIDPRQVLPGQFMAQGDLIAYVLPQEAPTVRTLVSNEDIALVRDRPGKILVRLASDDEALVNARLAGGVPEATTQLPTAALGQAAGGSIALDPEDTSGRTAREPHYQLDVQLDGAIGLAIGARALVTFQHGRTHVAALVARFVRRSFLGQFDS